MKDICTHHKRHEISTFKVASILGNWTGLNAKHFLSYNKKVHDSGDHAEAQRTQILLHATRLVIDRMTAT
jgi:hypothetical protein